MAFQNALVTGASDRLGRAMALALAERGINVAIHYHKSADKAAKTTDEISSHGVQSAMLQADLLDLDAAAKLVDTAANALDGPLDILINNASAFDWDTVEDATLESWESHHKSNLQSPFILTQKFAAQAPKATGALGDRVAGALILNMIDQRIRKLTPGFMTYSLSKHGAWAMTRTTAQALAPDIRVNAIGPGPTLRGANQSEAHYQHQRANTILERGADPADIVGAMNYFLDAHAVTGQLLCVDGGQHLGWKTPEVQGLD
ncbi:MAG: SDR family oxidoreductase [Pseudomonadota bacterium]